MHPPDEGLGLLLRLKISLNLGLWMRDVNTMNISEEMRNMRVGYRSWYYRRVWSPLLTQGDRADNLKSTICLQQSGFYSSL